MDAPPTKKRKANPQVKNFRLTIWTEDLLPKLSTDKVRYSVYQKEKCPTTGKEHYQTFLQYSRSRRLSAVRKEFPSTDVRVADNPKGARKYCMKEDTQLAKPIEYGTFKTKGERTDIGEFVELVKSGARRKDLIEEWPSIFTRYRHFYADTRAMFRPPDQPDKQVLLFCGPPGLGKTTGARELHPEAWLYPRQKGVWFPDYDGEEAALLDEFEGSLPLNILLALLHEFTEKVESKGGHVWWHPKTVIITCNLHPVTWYGNYYNRQIKYTALARRVTHVREYTDLGVYKEYSGDSALDWFGLTPDLQHNSTFHSKFPMFGIKPDHHYDASSITGAAGSLYSSSTNY